MIEVKVIFWILSGASLYIFNKDLLSLGFASGISIDIELVIGTTTCILLTGDGAGQPSSLHVDGLVCAGVSACCTLCVTLEGVGFEMKSWWIRFIGKNKLLFPVFCPYRLALDSTSPEVCAMCKSLKMVIL